ncbi:MAG: SagB/ThcOx family dehydrogenase [Candidatus Neomarinimicrobiota bacterium]
MSPTLGLPPPSTSSQQSLESTLTRRKSVRNFKDDPLSLAEVSQLLWAAQGMTHDQEHRTSPSAGALYPLEIYFVAGDVHDLAAGVYRYRPDHHELETVIEGDRRSSLRNAALNQDFLQECPAVMVISAVYERTTWKYGKRGERYIYMEVGHVAQNVSLQAVSLNLGTVVVGAFDDERVREIVNMPDDEKPLCLMPLGKPVS